ncbi:hypothetical protein L218DRAFT_957782 [Marasmius fiardii PR-910]|nr:hypothetical protein L218DRAFT_957782 [Marasmius fiardii PR-910]
MSNVVANQTQVIKTSLQSDLDEVIYGSSECSELSSPGSCSSPESVTTWEDVADLKSLSLEDEPSTASTPEDNSHYSSARSSPARELPLHFDLPTLFTTEDVRDNDSFLSLEEDATATAEYGDELLDDKVDLVEALTRGKPSFVSSVEAEKNCMSAGRRDHDAIARDRRTYLGDDWIKLLASIETGRSLRRTSGCQNSDSDSESESECFYTPLLDNLRVKRGSYPTTASTPGHRCVFGASD